MDLFVEKSRSNGSFRCLQTRWIVLRCSSALSICGLLLSLLPPAQAQPTTSSNADSPAAQAESRVSSAVERLAQLAQEQIDKHVLVGMAIAVVHRDKVIFAKGFGVREAGKDTRIDPDTVFQLASLSKPISATVVAKLVGDGKITWDSRISDLDPSFELHDPWVTREVTIRDLYAHRSGLPDHAGDLLEDMGYDREQILHRLRYQRLDSSFRSRYAYTNFGLTEGAVAAARAYGLTWEEASREKLFKPLGMQSTSGRYADFLARVNKAPGHVLVNRQWVPRSAYNPDAESPAGGISSSANDLARWMRMVLAKGKFAGTQVVSENALLEIEHPQILTQLNPFTGAPSFYGLGMNVSYDEHGRLRLSHTGVFAQGVSTAVTLVPSAQLGIVVLTNSYPVGVSEGLTATFTDLALDGEQKQDWLALCKKLFTDPAALGLSQGQKYAKAPKVFAPPLPYSAYVGTYTNKLYGDIAITQSSRGLSIAEGPAKLTFPMNHYTRDTFFYDPPGDNGEGASGVTFVIGANGTADAVSIETLNHHGQGVFERSEHAAPK